MSREQDVPDGLRSAPAGVGGELKAGPSSHFYGEGELAREAIVKNL
jgi:hypothetical protein